MEFPKPFQAGADGSVCYPVGSLLKSLFEYLKKLKKSSNSFQLIPAAGFLVIVLSNVFAKTYRAFLPIYSICTVKTVLLR